MQPQSYDSTAHRHRRSGFTLVELLIAMLVLAIGIMATLQMQFISLDSAMVSRDTTNSSAVARGVIDVMRVEAMQWRTDSITNDVTSSAFDDSAFESTPVLAAVQNGGWSWTRLFSGAVDSRLSHTGNTRYCAYARGGYLETNAVFTVQVAVVFPSANNSFPSSGNASPAFTCPDYDDTKLDDSMDPEANTGALQREGFQVQFFGTHINRNGHLGS